MKSLLREIPDGVVREGDVGDHKDWEEKGVVN